MKAMKWLWLFAMLFISVALHAQSDGVYSNDDGAVAGVFDNENGTYSIIYSDQYGRDEFLVEDWEDALENLLGDDYMRILSVDLDYEYDEGWTSMSFYNDAEQYADVSWSFYVENGEVAFHGSINDVDFGDLAIADDDYAAASLDDFLAALDDFLSAGGLLSSSALDTIEDFLDSLDYIDGCIQDDEDDGDGDEEE